jgi:hypothetical protein
MGNSTISLQDVMDSIASIGDLQTVLDHTGGWADEPALSIGNDVMKELLSIRFPWKWNRIKVAPFPLNPLQQDYASLTLKNLGWLENGLRIDVNNSTYPPPTWPIFAVRDLQMSSDQHGFPYQYCWFYNADLEFGKWPGPQKPYINPIGATTPPKNGPVNILDANENILVLSGYGVTGNVQPLAPDVNPIGAVILDGTCQWTVADPDAQGFRFYPMPPSGGQVWLTRLWGQKKAPAFTALTQKLDPLPDDELKWFRDGCIAYCHRYTTNPAVKARYPQVKAEWIGAMELATKKNDREDEAKGFFPDKSVMSPSYTTDPGPYPYRYGWR